MVVALAVTLTRRSGKRSHWKGAHTRAVLGFYGDRWAPVDAPSGAGDRIRTGDTLLGRQALYR